MSSDWVFARFDQRPADIVSILQATGQATHLRAALDQAIGDLRRALLPERGRARPSQPGMH